MKISIKLTEYHNSWLIIGIIATDDLGFENSSDVNTDKNVYEYNSTGNQFWIDGGIKHSSHPWNSKNSIKNGS